MLWYGPSGLPYSTVRRTAWAPARTTYTPAGSPAGSRNAAVPTASAVALGQARGQQALAGALHFEGGREMRRAGHADAHAASRRGLGMGSQGRGGQQGQQQPEVFLKHKAKE